MKFTILLSSTILFATALTPISAYADDSNLKCRRMANGCDTHNNGGSERISISGFDIEVKSSDRGNRNRNTIDRNTGNRNTAARNKDNIGNGNDDTVSAAGADNADAGTDNNDTGASNNSPPQHNSNDIKGFDPFSGLYGPGT